MAVLTRTRARAIAFATAACCAAALPARAGQRSSTAEDEIKATFLLNFTRFVEWPANGAAGPFRLCTLGSPAFAAAVSRTIAGESTDGRPIAQATPGTPEEARTCHILFVSRLENGHVDRWVAAVHGQPVLVVGETKSAADAGAAITFVVENNRVKFDVNDQAAAQAGLKISSKLLRVARHVTAQGGTR